MFKRMSVTSRVVLMALVLVGVVVVATISYSGLSAKPQVTAINMNTEKIAIHGYDTVAYFTEGRARKGKSEFQHNWQGARWHFASATNRDLFAVNPERYAPRYGGYCSLGLAMGEHSDTDPKVWTIVDGKLYLNKGNKYRDFWLKGTKAYIFAGDVNWRKYRDKLRVNDNLRD